MSRRLDVPQTIPSLIIWNINRYQQRCLHVCRSPVKQSQTPILQLWMKIKTNRPTCYSLVCCALLLALGIFVVIQTDGLRNSPLQILSFITTTDMGDEAAKVHTTDSPNAFSRIFTSCTSFVRSVTKTGGHEEPQFNRLSSTKTRQNSSKGKRRLQKVSPPIHKAGDNNESPSHKPKMPTTDLFRVIEDGSFWTMPDNDLLIIIRDEFPDELNRLKNAYSVRTTGIPRPSCPSISQILYKADYDEINRTLIGVLALRWLWHDEYGHYVGEHTKSSSKLHRSSFNWMHDMFRNALKSPIDIYALVVSMIINDLGKDHNLATDYCRKKKIDISNVNHDMILLHAVEVGMIPALNKLPEPHRSQIITGVKLGAEFNFGQLAQGENAPASLSGLLAMRGEDRAFELRFIEQLLDLSGAAGHEDWTCARKMTEPVFQSYRNVYAAAKGIISRQLSLREAYDIIPAQKLELLHQAGWDGKLDLAKKYDRALARLFCLGNTNNKDTAEMYVEAFGAISDREREMLIEGLNIDGSVEEPAVQTTYAPAMLSKATSNTANGTREEKVNAIAALLGYLARCFDVTIGERVAFRKQKVMVIERDIRSVDKVVSGEGFKSDCFGSMRACEVPKGVPANYDHSYADGPARRDEL
jgi:hypothetical protein